MEAGQGRLVPGQAGAVEGRLRGGGGKADRGVVEGEWGLLPRPLLGQLDPPGSLPLPQTTPARSPSR